MRFMNLNSCLLLVSALAVSACQHTVNDCDQLPYDSTVGNAGCLIIKQDKLLMVQQRINGLWALPGGTAEQGERAACTAQRETREETGLDVAVGDKLITLENGFHLYRCHALHDQLAEALDRVEITGWEWLNREQRSQLPWRFAEQHGLIDGLVQEQQALDLQQAEAAGPVIEQTNPAMVP